MSRSEPSSQSLLQTGVGPVAGGVRRTAGPRHEEVRDAGQQVRLSRAERELRGGVGVDVVVIGHGQGQSHVPGGCARGLRTWVTCRE